MERKDRERIEGIDCRGQIAEGRLQRADCRGQIKNNLQGEVKRE